MVIYDLTCAGGHRFEGWFQDLEAYQAQATGGQLECPVCGTRDVAKTVTGSAIRRSAEDRAGVAALPQLQAPAAHPAAPVPAPAPAPPAVTPEMVREFLVTLSSHLRTHSEDVGPRFAEEARKIHQGDAPERLIRGTSTDEEERDLQEDGIPFLKVPMVTTDD